MLISVLILVLIFTIVPFAVGLIPAYFIAKPRRTIAVIYIGGFLYDLAIFQLVAVPFIISNPWGFESIIILYSILMAVSVVAGFTLMAIKKKKEAEIVAKEKEASQLKYKYFGPQGELYKKQQSLIKPIQDDIYAACKKVCEEKGYQVIFDRASSQSIIFASPRIDVSNEVLAKLGYSK